MFAVGIESRDEKSLLRLFAKTVFLRAEKIQGAALGQADRRGKKEYREITEMNQPPHPLWQNQE